MNSYCDQFVNVGDVNDLFEKWINSSSKNDLILLANFLEHLTDPTLLTGLIFFMAAITPRKILLD